MKNLDQTYAQTYVGTPLYMAPEISEGNYSKSVDIYALCGTFYFLIKKREPYFNDSILNKFK